MSEMPQTLADLIPKSHGAYWGFGIAVCAAGAGLGYGYLRLPELAANLGVETISALDISQVGSLFHWMLTVLWLLAALACFAVFQVGRRERQRTGRADLSDIWLWGGLAALLLSIDTMARLRLLLRDLLVLHAGTRFDEQGNYWWIAIYAIVFGMIGTRLAVEMWNCYRPAFTFYVVALCLFLGSCAVMMGPLDRSEQWTPERIAVLYRGLEMAAVLMLLFSFSVFARRLVLPDPETGLQWLDIVSKSGNSGKAKESATETTSEKSSVFPKKVKAVTFGGGVHAPSESPEELAQKRHGS